MTKPAFNHRRPMQCGCGGQLITVHVQAPKAGTILRWRKCSQCHAQVRTVEVIEAAETEARHTRRSKFKVDAKHGFKAFLTNSQKEFLESLPERSMSARLRKCVMLAKRVLEEEKQL